MISFFFVLILLYSGLFLDHHRVTGSGKSTFSKFSRKRSVVSLIFSSNISTSSVKLIGNSNSNNVSTNMTIACRWLRGYKHQNKMCRRRRGLPETLQLSRQIAVENCKEQFRYERWNCSYKKSYFKKLYRETAFLHAITGAAIAHSIARACSEGKIENCGCARPDHNEQPRYNWKWGGCGDNTKQAKKITKKFLQLKKKKGQDRFSVALNYNTEVGLATLSGVEIKVCTCHGVSASCIMKTCWKRLQPFPKVAEKLRIKYHTAILQTSKNTIKQRTVKKEKGNSNLIYFEESPNFCQETVGRECSDADNCATLCCGRGFEILEVVQEKQCRCHWKQCSFDVECETCHELIHVYRCK